jgi:hypothetical protein
MNNLIQTNITKLQRLTKYILMGLIVVIATRYIPDNVLKTKEIIMIGATSSISFAILDMISPAVRISQDKKPVSESENKSVSTNKVATKAKIETELKPKPKPKVLVEAFG